MDITRRKALQLGAVSPVAALPFVLPDVKFRSDDQFEGKIVFIKDFILTELSHLNLHLDWLDKRAAVHSAHGGVNGVMMINKDDLWAEPHLCMMSLQYSDMGYEKILDIVSFAKRLVLVAKREKFSFPWTFYAQGNIFINKLDFAFALLETATPSKQRDVLALADVNDGISLKRQKSSKLLNSSEELIQSIEQFAVDADLVLQDYRREWHK